MDNSFKCVASEEFDNITINYKNNPSLENGKIFARTIQFLVHNILLVHKPDGLDIDLLKKKCIYKCFDNLQNFDLNKGHAFNYFTILVINKIRKINLSKINELEKENKYGCFLNLV